ncbi:MAG: GNAT family N-acetyltransferase [Microthrixaceae bacterium]
MRVRFGNNGEEATLQELEAAADQRFLAIGMDNVARRNPPSLDFLRQAVAEQRLWVAEVDSEEAGGYAVAVFVDAAPHLQIVAVHPSHQGRGVGRALVNAVADWAAGNAAAHLTLTTFRDVAWNRPLYERLGFVVMEESKLTPGLRQIRDEEIALGLDDDGPRVAMLRVL